MTPTPITKKQFIGWFIVFTIGMALWALPGDLWAFAVGIVAFSNLFLVAPCECSRPLRMREVLWIFVGLCVFAVLMFASKRWLPVDFGAPVARDIRHPSLVAVLWALAAWLPYRRYKAL